MPTRGKRPQTKAPKYKDSGESESGGDFEDSGSEASIPKDAEDDDDSPVISEDDFEEEVPKRIVNKKTSIFRQKPTVSKMPQKSRISMATIKKNLQSVGDKLKSSEDSPTDPEVPFNIKLLTDTEKLLPSFLNLSESDTDDSDIETKVLASKDPLPFKTFVQKREPEGETPTDKDKENSIEESIKDVARLSDSGTDSEMEDVEPEIQGKKGEGIPSKKLNFSHLQEQAKKLADAKQSLESYNKRYSDSKKTEEVVNIHELLAMGETEPSEKVPGPESTSEVEDSGDSDVEDLEEVKGEAKSTIPKGGIQLVLDLPTDRPKTKNKQLDLEMMLKRRMNRVKKEYQVFTHKVHVLCWLGHGNFANKTINNQSIMAAALSLIPSEHCYPSARIDIKYVEQVTKWYNGAMNLKEDKAEFKFKPNKRPLELALLQQIDKKTATSKKNLTLIFVSMLRALGVKCRVVFSFRVVPLRPPDTELCSLAVKNKDPPKKASGKDGKTSKHFETASTSTADKNKKVKSSSATAKLAGKSKNVSKNESFEDISQLDGLDDRDLSKSNPHGTRQVNSRKSLALKKTGSAQQPKTETPSPKASGSSTMSYWDQIMQNTLEEEPKVEKRISHRNLSLKSPPAVSKIKLEPTSIFNESTISLGNPPFVKPPEKERDFSSALKNFLDVSPVKNAGVAKVTSSTGRKSSTAAKNKNLNEKGSRASLRTTKTVQTPPAKDVLNVPKVVRKSKSPNSDTETVSCSKKRRVVKKAVLATDKAMDDHLDAQNKVSVTTIKALTPRATTSKAITSKTTPIEKQIVPKGKLLKKTSLPEKIKEILTVEENKVAKPSRSRPKPASDQGSTTKSSISDKSVPIKSLPNRGKLSSDANSVPKLPQNRTKALPKQRSSNAPLTSGKQKEVDNPGSQVKSTQRKSRSTVPAAVSKYFSSPENAANLKKPPAGLSKSAEKRVSHRDLMNKSLPGTSSRPRSNVDVTKDIVSLVKDRIRESKAQARSKLVRGKIQQSSDDSDNMEVEDFPKGRSRKDSRNSDADFKPSKKRSAPKTIVDRRVLSTDDDQSTDGAKKRGVDVWCEVYVEEEEQWISVDVVKAQVHCSREIYTRTTHPVTYIVSWDSAGHLKDVTRRYVPHWNTTTRKLRADPAWYSECLQPWLAPRSMRETQEDKQLERMQLDAPLPVAISEYKNHPLYALKRHLLKFEVIYPPDAVTLGFVKKEAVYARDCVHVCRSREKWVKEAKVVRPAEEPYKIVKCPKWDRSTRTIIKGVPLEIFGPWQVGDYVPPQAENGMVPRNPYGNVELFKKCMLPKGTVHLQLQGLNKVARKLGIDCAPAMTGFDCHSGWPHPVYDGFVVCEEFKEQITVAWEQEQEEAEARAREKIDKRVYGNWRRIIRGLFIRERLKARYDFASELPQNQNPDPGQPGGSKAKKRPKGPRFLAKKRRSGERSSESDSA